MANFVVWQKFVEHFWDGGSKMHKKWVISEFFLGSAKKGQSLIENWTKVRINDIKRQNNIYIVFNKIILLCDSIH